MPNDNDTDTEGFVYCANGNCGRPIETVYDEYVRVKRKYFCDEQCLEQSKDEE